MPEAIPPIQITQQAIGDHVKGVAEDLDVTLTTVYRFLSDEGYDPYGRFLALHKSLQRRNPEGAELLFQDFKARRDAGRQPNRADRDTALKEAITILAEAVGARGSADQFKLKAAKVIDVMGSIIRGDT